MIVQFESCILKSWCFISAFYITTATLLRFFFYQQSEINEFNVKKVWNIITVF